jgi:hypothetical protein
MSLDNRKGFDAINGRAFMGNTLMFQAADGAALGLCRSSPSAAGRST